jgi:hypothetical protein
MVNPFVVVTDCAQCCLTSVIEGTCAFNIAFGRQLWKIAYYTFGIKKVLSTICNPSTITFILTKRGPILLRILDAKNATNQPQKPTKQKEAIIDRWIFLPHESWHPSGLVVTFYFLCLPQASRLLMFRNSY